MNWARLVVLIYFVRCISAVSPALRFSIVPLLDSIFGLLQAEPDTIDPSTPVLNGWRVERPSLLIPLKAFMNTQYFLNVTAPPSASAKRVSAK
jgi:hypothetical protein